MGIKVCAVAAKRVLSLRRPDCVNAQATLNLCSSHATESGLVETLALTHTLLLTINDLANGLDNPQQTDGILLDFSNAFDKVPTADYSSQTPSLWCSRKGPVLDTERLSRQDTVTLECQASFTSPVTS